MNNEWKDGLPPVGAECEADDSDSPNGVFKGVITAEGRNHYLVANDFWELPFHKHKVRPIKSDADKVRDDQIMDLDAALRKTQKLSGEYLYNQGCRMTRELNECAIEKIVAIATKGAAESLYHYEKQAAKLAVRYVLGEIDL